MSDAGRITIEQVAKFPRPGTVVPANLRFTPDGTALTYLFSAEGSLVRSLWRYEIVSGGRKVIAGPPPASTNEQQLSREEELRRERARLRELGVTSYEFARKAERETLLVPSGAGLFVAFAGGSLEPLPRTEGAIDPHLSPDGRHVAFVRNGELYVAATVGGEPSRLTFDAEDGLTNGLAEFLAQEELDRPEGFWWAPDNRRIAFERADERHIQKLPIVHQGADSIDVEYHRYPFAGQRNAVIELGVIDIETGSTTWMELGEERDFYLARVGWRPDGVLVASILSRDQRTLSVSVFDDSGSRTLLWEERGEPWINLDSDMRFLDSGELVLTSERTGFRHIYVHDNNGAELRALTSGEWVVTGVASIDEVRRIVYFHGTRDGVTNRHLYAVSLDGGDVRRLTEGDGWHACIVSQSGDWFLDGWSSLAHAPRLTLRRTDGSEQRPFAENDVSAYSLGLAVPLLVTLPAADGTTLHGAIYRPAMADASSTPSPVIVSVYGGPHAQRVADEWSLTVDLRAQYLAQQGFVVFKLDNRGSANRGLAFEAVLADRMGRIEVEDQVTGVRFLETLGYADTKRVGIYGWSYGGYMTGMCMFRRPDVFKVGVAGAPVADWDGYDTGYTERYMRTPAENPDGYRDGSLLRHAGQLEGKLMLIHGGVDENVHFRHTARLIVALTEAQKNYDLLMFPEERHMPRDQKGLEYQERRLVRYFEENL